MARSKSLAAQRRELSYIVHRLTSYTSAADRDILEGRLEKLLSGELTTEFYAMAEEVFDKLRLTNPPLVDDARGIFYSMLSEVKYEIRTPTETTTMMTVGLFLSAIFKTEPPTNILSEETAEKLAALLKKHYFHPDAKVVIFHELLRSNQGPVNNSELARPMLERMKASKSALYAGEHLDIPEGQDDPILAQEEDRSYSLYLRHAVIAVTVPAGELTVVHPYRWSENPFSQLTAENGATFDPNRISNNAWTDEALDVLRDNVRGFNPVVTEPFPIIRGMDFLEQVMAPFRMLPFVMNAVHSLHCEPKDLCASIALFCSRPDAVQIYANEIRIALARTSDRGHPFSGDCITLQAAGEDINMITGNMERFLQVLGVTDIVFHEEPRYFEVEDGEGRIYVNADGISTTLSAPGTHGAPKIPAHLLN